MRAGAESAGKIIAGQRNGVRRGIIGGLFRERGFPFGGDQLQRPFRMSRPAVTAGGAAHRAAGRLDLVILDEIAGGALRTGQYHDKRIGRPSETRVEVADFGPHVQEAHRPAN